MGARGLRWVAVISLVLIGSMRLSTPAPSWGGLADQEDANIVVQFTSPAAGARLSGAAAVEGFAGDRRSASGSGLNEKDVQLYLDLPPGAVDSRNLFAVPGTFREAELSVEDPRCCSPGLPAALVFYSSWS